MSRRKAEPVDLTAYQFTSHDMDRFMSKVIIDPETGCWEWRKAALSDDGYGQFSIKGRRVQAHRAVYISVFGPIPGGHELDHECVNSWCVNPCHTKPVTKYVNLKLRGWRMAGSVRCARKIRSKISREVQA